LEQKDREDYAGAQKTMRPLWSAVGERPQTEGLHPSVAAEVLLTAGILTGWIGSKDQVEKAQESAKDLISESINYFGSAGDQPKVAAARVELAFCYYREGEMNESRIMIREALGKLMPGGNTTARALLKLSAIECSAGRYHEAFTILTDNAAIFRRLTNHTIKGGYHAEMAIILPHLTKSEKIDETLAQAVSHFQKADHEFRLARNNVYRADVKNNVSLILLKLCRYKEAHKYLDEARRLSVRFRDRARTAQYDETKAQVLIAEGKHKEAATLARQAAFALEKSGHHCMMAEAMITQAVALGRSGASERAHFIFQQAIQTALRVNALNMAGLAALTLIEEVQLDPLTLQAAYQQAREWLAGSQRQDVLRRLNDAAEKLVQTLTVELDADEASEVIFAKPFSLQNMMLKHEGALIKKALAQSNGSVTHAASLLGMSYQSLCYILDSRHKELQKDRSPKRRRAKSGSNKA
jgi:tetratricopeptide (TPR) repeat protein